MLKYALALLLAITPLPAFAGCAFDFNGENDCDDDYNSVYEDEAPSDSYGYGCTCTETSDSTSSTVWVPNPSGDGGNYETVTTPGTTRSVPCPCQ